MGKNFKIAPKQDSEIWANIYALLLAGLLEAYHCGSQETADYLRRSKKHSRAG